MNNKLKNAGHLTLGDELLFHFNGEHFSLVCSAGEPHNVLSALRYPLSCPIAIISNISEQLLLPYDGEYQPEWALRAGGNILEFPAGASGREMVSHKV